MTLPLPLQLLAPVVCLLGALHDIFRIIRVVSHDALNHIGVFLMKMLVDHGGNDLLPFKKILHHRVVHHVLLVIQGRVILHDRLRSSPCLTVYNSSTLLIRLNVISCSRVSWSS